MEDLTSNPLIVALCSMVAGGGLTQIIISIISRVKSKGEKMNDIAHFMAEMQKMSSNIITTVQKISGETNATMLKSFGETISTVQKTYDSIIESEQKAVEMANRNYDMSQAREERLLKIISQDKVYRDTLERKNSQKRSTINRAYDCEHLIGVKNPIEECAVLKANSEYYKRREHCESCVQEIKDSKE